MSCNNSVDELPTQHTQLTQITPAQRQRNNDPGYFDESQIRENELNGSSYDWANNSPPNASQLFANINNYESPPSDSNWPLVDKMNHMFKSNTRSAFVTQLMSESGGKEDELEVIRSTIYDACKCLDDYTFPKDVDLKRRKKTRSCESVSLKLAHDIYAILSSMDSRCYSDMKDVLSLPKPYNRAEHNGSASDQVMLLRQDLKMLQDQMVKCQSDIITLKQDKLALKKVIDDDIKSVRADISRFRKDTGDQIYTIQTDIQRIEDEKSSGLTSVKNSLKLVSNDIDHNRQESDEFMNELRNKIDGVNKKIDRHFSKLESKIIDLQRRSIKMCASTSANELRVSDEGSVNNTNSQPSYRAVISGGADHSSSQFTRPHDNHSVENIDVPLQHEISGLTEQSTSSSGGVVQEKRADQNGDLNRENCSGNLRANYNQPTIVEKVAQNKIPVIISDERPKPSKPRREDTLLNVQNEQIVSQGDDEDFTEYVVQKTKRFFVGGFKQSITVQKLTAYVTNRGAKVTMVRIFKKRYGRSVIIRLNVETPDAKKVSGEGFWPRGVTCRPWLTKNNYAKKTNGSTEKNNVQNDDDLTNDILANDAHKQNFRSGHSRNKYRSDQRRYSDNNRGNGEAHTYNCSTQNRYGYYNDNPGGYRDNVNHGNRGYRRDDQNCKD